MTPATGRLRCAECEREDFADVDALLEHDCPESDDGPDPEGFGGGLEVAL